MEGKDQGRRLQRLIATSLFYTAKICLQKALFAAIFAPVTIRLFLFENENKIEANRIITR